MKSILCLFLFALADVGYSKHNKHNKKISVQRIGLTEAEAQALVDDHNEWRRKADSRAMRKLEWDDDLATDAMAWATHCTFEHGHPGKQAFTKGHAGQNLGYSTRTADWKNSTFVVWVNEYKYYNFTTNSCPWPPCGHYKQVMWEKTNKIGCAYYVCPKMYNNQGAILDRRAKYLVCNYYPPGNVYGGRPWNIGKTCEYCHYCQDNLCVSREACMSDPNTCSCHKKCQHCGTLTADCRCECPPGFHGDECQYICRDRKVECYYYDKSDCNDGTKTGKVIYDFCDRVCEKCLPSTNTSWTCGEETYQNTIVKYGSTPQYSYKTQDNNNCVFPFRYNGKYHDHCLPEGNTTWCSRSADYDTYRTAAFGCRTVKTTRGNSNGADCVFPFKFRGQYYQKCLHHKAIDKHWCSTTENFDKDKKYGYCEFKSD